MGQVILPDRRLEMPALLGRDFRATSDVITDPEHPLVMNKMLVHFMAAGNELINAHIWNLSKDDAATVQNSPKRLAVNVAGDNRILRGPLGLSMNPCKIYSGSTTRPSSFKNNSRQQYTMMCRMTWRCTVSGYPGTVYMDITGGGTNYMCYSAGGSPFIKAADNARNAGTGYKQDIAFVSLIDYDAGTTEIREYRNGEPYGAPSTGTTAYTPTAMTAYYRSDHNLTASDSSDFYHFTCWDELLTDEEITYMLSYPNRILIPV